MSRQFSKFVNKNAEKLLNLLANKDNEPVIYQQAMTQLGTELGKIILDKISSYQSSIYIACTVEDADYLAQGIISKIEENSFVSFACFWNKRFSPFDIQDLKISPILKKYQEPCEENIDYLIITKSIISGACVVRTNLTNLIQKINPKHIFIVAPVIYYNAEEKLKNEFEESIHSKFKFFYFAKDDERTSTGEVIPGIGGSVYERLGFLGQDDKNSHIPDLVKKRRSQFTTLKK